MLQIFKPLRIFNLRPRKTKEKKSAGPCQRSLASQRECQFSKLKPYPPSSAPPSARNLDCACPRPAGWPREQPPGFPSWLMSDIWACKSLTTLLLYVYSKQHTAGDLSTNIQEYKLELLRSNSFHRHYHRASKVLGHTVSHRSGMNLLEQIKISEIYPQRNPQHNKILITNSCPISPTGSQELGNSTHITLATINSELALVQKKPRMSC